MAVAALFTVLGRILLFLAAAQLPPLVFALAEADAATARGFAVGIVCAVFVGVMLVLVGQGDTGRLGRREAPLLAVAGWTLAAVFAAIPLSLSDAVPDLSGSLLEAMSGVTATGLSVIPSIDAAPRGIVLWRALLQWSGGLATIVFVAMLVPRIAEAAPLDPARPRFGRVASGATLIYALLTLATAVALAFAGASPFEAACYAMSSISTGGFAAGDGGPTALGPGVQAILVLAMAAGAVNVLGAWRVGSARAGAFAGSAEPGLFVLLAIAGAGTVAAVTGGASGGPMGETVWRALFAAVSSLTTTGFDAGLAPPTPTFVILCLAGLALVGGAVGSTAGGVKLMRVLLLLRQSVHELERLAHPHRVSPVKVGGASIPERAVQGVRAFFVMFVSCLIVLTLVLAAHGLDFAAASVLALSALTNSGPLLAETVAAVPDLAALGWSGDIAMAAGMLVGRLEVIAFFVVLSPPFWRR